MLAISRLLGALWLGSAVFLMLAASAAFRSSPNSTVAADVVGAMLNRWHYIALAAPLALFAFELRHARKLVLAVLFAAIVIAAAQAFVDLRIRSIRMTSAVAMSELPKSDPIRRRFGALHGVSMMLLLLQAVAAAIVVAAPESRHRDHVAVDVQLAEGQPQGAERLADLPGVADDHDQ
jgi:hypothetical protein